MSHVWEAALAAGDGVIVRREHPRIGSSLDRALSRGHLVPLLPGIYRARTAEPDLAMRVRAAVTFDPDAVVVGEAAATLGWWPERAATTVDLATTGRRADGDGIRWCQRRVPPELVVDRGPVRFTDVALTVLDLIPSLGGQVIDEALRRRVVTLAHLESTFAGLPPRRGDVLRRVLLEDSRDEPWSEAERELQRGYRALDLPYGYRTNFPVTLPDGTVRFVDLAVPDLLLGFEVDGWEWHGDHESFVRDRASDAHLATLSWQRVRFDAPLVFDRLDDVKGTMRDVVAAREALFRGLRPTSAPRPRRGRWPRN